MTLRDLTEKQVAELQHECEEAIRARQFAREVPIDTFFAKLFFSDGMKAILKRIEKLP